MVGIVETYGDKVFYIADAGAEPRFAGDGLHPLQVRFLDFGKSARGQHRAVDVLHDL